MKYIAPYGVSDSNASYHNGDSAIGLEGSIPPAKAFEDPMRELVNLIEHADYTPDEDDLEQVTKSVRSQSLNYAVDTGSANALAVAFDPPFVALTVGLPIRVLVAHNNTTSSTIAINSLTAVAIRKANGSNVVAGDLLAGEVVELVFDGSYFQITNFQGVSSTSENNNNFTLQIPYIPDTSVTANTITAIFNPAITQLDAGDPILVLIANTNTGPVSITVNSLPSKNVKGLDLENLESGQMVEDQMALMIYDGTQFQLSNPAVPRAGVGITGGVQIAGRFVYQDLNYHITTVADSYVEGFRVSYEPVSAGNQIHVQMHGAFNAGASVGWATGRAVNGFISYSTDNGSTWNPPSFPGRDYPTAGTFEANPAMAEVIEGSDVGVVRIDFNFTMSGELTVPAGPPSTIIFRLMFAASNSASPTAMLHGGTMVEITEYAG